MNALQSHSIACPYCGEAIELLVDTSVDEQSYIEDCQVCCRPIEISVWSQDEAIVDLQARSEND